MAVYRDIDYNTRINGGLTVSQASTFASNLTVSGTLAAGNVSDIVSAINDKFASAGGTVSGNVTISGDLTVSGTITGVDLSQYYTKTNLQTNGQASVHWNNITDKPTYDNYVKWILKQNTEETGADVITGTIVDFKNGSNISITRTGTAMTIANTYTHPSSHAATMITEDTTHRFVADTEKVTWNAKADAHTHPYDNYQNWILKQNTEGTGQNVTTGSIVDFKNGSNISITRSASAITIANTYSYTHPANHSPSIITQDASNRFVTDTLISTWNAKSDAHTHPYTPDTHPTVIANVSLGHIKTGGDITIDATGIVTVVDDSHNHIISNVDGLQTALDSKAPTHTHPYDNYQSWLLKANTDTGVSITSGAIVDIKSSGATTISRSSSTITISSTNTTYTASNGLQLLTTEFSVKLGTSPGLTADANGLVNSDKGSSQYIFKNVTVGGTTSSANINDDTLTFAASGDIQASISGKTVTYTHNDSDHNTFPTLSSSNVFTANSESIKIKPTTDTYTARNSIAVVIGDVFSNIGYNPIDAMTEEVWSASGKTGTQYTRGIDYDIDYYAGKIKRHTDSSISNGATVYVSFYQTVILLRINKNDDSYTYFSIDNRGNMYGKSMSVLLSSSQNSQESDVQGDFTVQGNMIVNGNTTLGDDATTDNIIVKGSFNIWDNTSAKFTVDTTGTVTAGIIPWARLSSIPSASTTASGIVQLSSAIDSDSTTLAATAVAVKSAYDLANGKWTYSATTIQGIKVNAATNADTVNSLTVLTAVPTGAVFTDTVYTHPANHPASIITEDATHRFFTDTERTKLSGIATSANNYTHPTNDGNLHVPATSTTNNLKVLKAGSTAGVMAWGNVDWGELTSKPSSFTPSTHYHSNLQNIDDRDRKPVNTSKGYLELVFTSLGGMTGTENQDYQDMLVLNSYIDASGGNVNALIFDKSEMKIRHYQAAQADTTWGTPKQLAYISSTITDGEQNSSPSCDAVYDGLATKVAANTAITGATKCKITYDSKGLVTAGADLTASDLPTNHNNYIPVAQTTWYSHTPSAWNDASIVSRGGAEDGWIFCDGVNGQYGIYHRQIDSNLVVAGNETLLSNSIAFIGGNSLASYINLSGGHGYFKGNLKVGGTIDTGQGATELYLMDQNVKTTSSPTFAGQTLTGPLTLASTTPVIHFNGSSDTGIDMSIKATPEGLDFYEPEDNDRIHFRIYDDAGVDAPYGYQVNATVVIDASRNLVNIETINTGQGATEVYLMDQNVKTTDGVTFNAVTSTTSVTASSAAITNGVSAASVTATGTVTATVHKAGNWDIKQDATTQSLKFVFVT